MKLRYLFAILAVFQLLPWILLLTIGSVDSGHPLFYMTEVAALAGCAFLWIFYRKVLRPINTLSGGLDMLRSQDWNSSLRKVGQPEVDNIAGVFNEMFVKLKKQRIRYEERTHFLHLLIEKSPIGVMVTDFDGEEVMRNPSAVALGLSVGKLRDLEVGKSRDYRTSSGATIRCSCQNFIDRGVEHRFYLAEDITRSVTAAERLAYEKVIRVMAHEVNNTMAGFSSALSTALPEISDPDLREVLGACWKRSDELSDFTARFAAVVKLPPADLHPARLSELLASERRFLESIAYQKGITIRFIEDVERSDEILADPGLLSQVFVNIVKNSVESIAVRKEGEASEEGFHGEISIEIKDTSLTFIDNGIGISEEKSPMIFTPFYTDKPTGQGIGLTLIRDVLMSHNAGFSLSTSPEDGLTRFVINFPDR